MTSETSALRKPLGLTGEMYRRALLGFAETESRWMMRNPVMFVVEVGSVLTTALWIQALAGQGEAPAWYIGFVSLWLWFTVLFANFSEALAEGGEGAGRGTPQCAERDAGKASEGAPARGGV
jgi:K+-transporting ATPase ATPase B chain